jgi:DNA-binding MurR/RpiR family transcriptional regulator
MEDSPTAVEQRFAKARPRLRSHRQQLVRAMIDHCEQTCFLSSREVARLYNVDAATVVRTVQALGYSGFADFAEDLRQHLFTRITPYTALKAATRVRRGIADHVDGSLQKALDSLNLLVSHLDRNEVIETARMISGARRILVVGADFAASLAFYLSYGLTALGLDAEAPVTSEGNLQHKVKLLTRDDLLVAISFGKCLRVTVECAQRAARQGAATLGITDTDATPVARYCRRHLLAEVVNPSFLNSYVAPMALISATLVACAHLDPKRSLTRLKATDHEYLTGARWYREPREQ